MNVEAGQRWEIALGADGQWRPAEIVSVRGDQVQAVYLDLGSAPESMRAVMLSRRQMLENKTRYRMPQYS